MPAGHIFVLLTIQAGVLFCHEESKLYPLVLPRAEEITESGSGSIYDLSGSGILLPTDIGSTVIPDYDSTCFISLTFSKLNQQQYHDSNLQECVSSLLVTVLSLDSSPLIILMESGNVSISNLLAYFAVEGTCGTTLQSYAQILATTNYTGWTNFSETYGLSAIEVKTVTTPMPWWHWSIIGFVILLAASAYLLIVIACCCRCYGLKRKKVSHVKGGYLQLDEVKLLEETRQHLARKVSRVNFQSRSHVHFFSHLLSVVDLEQLVVNPSPLYSEYATVPSNMVTLAEVPAGAEDKNRYRDVLPNPQTRVALLLKFGAANSDYINANYIRGYNKTSSKSYIATQGPLHWTVADFWRMVWEQKSSIIVMITNLNEKGMAKCVQYWPEERLSHSIVYEDLEVHLKRRIITKNYTTTTLLLQHKDKMVSRELTHFWFTGWPDHDVPTVQAVLEFLVHVRKHVSVDMPGPTVVHCSAGIGRTGVFIGADIAMQQLDEENEVDIMHILSSLRQDRGGMIQTKEQYVFIHQVLLRYAKCHGKQGISHNHGRLETTIEEDEPV